MTNLPPLQTEVEREERSSGSTPLHTGGTEPLDETFAGASLPGTTTLQHGEHKVLGVRWNVRHDSLVFDFREVAAVADELHPTKRNVISVIGRFYDSLGYLSPTISFKIYMQEIFRSKVGWDEKLTGSDKVSMQ